MRKVSKEKKYKDKHTGIYYSQMDINRKETEAKKRLRHNQYQEHGFAFCVKCGVNSNYSIIDCSHHKSKLWCKNNSEIELIWNIENMELICRKCHQKKDKLDTQFNSTI